MAEQNDPMMAEPTNVTHGPDILALREDEINKILSGQMPDEEKALALNQEFEKISVEEFGSIIKLSVENSSNEYMLACVENEVNKIFKKILVACANLAASYLANMKLFSYEKILESVNVAFPNRVLVR